ASDTLVFDSAMVGLSELEMEGEQETENDYGTVSTETEYEFEGAFQIDLLAGTKLSELMTIQPGTYNEIEAEISPVLDNGHSVYIEAQYTDTEGTTYPVVYYTDEDIDFEVESENGIQVNDQEFKELIVRIDLYALFNSIDLSKAEMDESGTILINEDHNEELAEMIVEYLDEHSEFEEGERDDDDEDDDDDDEDDDNDDDDDSEEDDDDDEDDED
ncbi:MAG: hypothetical protein ACQER7_09495, partial [Bacteroidota bacterium]